GPHGRRVRPRAFRHTLPPRPQQSAADVSGRRIGTLSKLESARHRGWKHGGNGPELDAPREYGHEWRGGDGRYAGGRFGDIDARLLRDAPFRDVAKPHLSARGCAHRPAVAGRHHTAYRSGRYARGGVYQLDRRRPGGSGSPADHLLELRGTEPFLLGGRR